MTKNINMNLFKKFIKPVNHIYIRFNTKNTGPEDPLIWRIFVDGQEQLASSVKIH